MQVNGALTVCGLKCICMHDKKRTRSELPVLPLDPMFKLANVLPDCRVNACDWHVRLCDPF